MKIKPGEEVDCREIEHGESPENPLLLSARHSRAKIVRDTYVVAPLVRVEDVETRRLE
jgi:hypothetical protein